MVVGVNVLVQLVGMTAPTAGQQVLIPLFQVLGLVTIAAPLALGIPAVMISRRPDPVPEPRTTQVYPPAD